jgi:hypothetical protein
MSTDIPRISSVVKELVVTVETVMANRFAGAPDAFAALRERVKAAVGSPRSVGVLDERAIMLLDVLDLITRKRRCSDDRAVRAWLQVAGVMLPDLREDLATAITREVERI